MQTRGTFIGRFHRKTIRNPLPRKFLDSFNYRDEPSSLAPTAPQVSKKETGVWKQVSFGGRNEDKSKRLFLILPNFNYLRHFIRRIRNVVSSCGSILSTLVGISNNDLTGT